MSSAALFRSKAAISHRNPHSHSDAASDEAILGSTSLYPSQDQHHTCYEPLPVVRNGVTSAGPPFSSSAPPFTNFQLKTMAPPPPTRSKPFGDVKPAGRSLIEASTAQHGATFPPASAELGSPFETSPTTSSRHRSSTDMASLSSCRVGVPLNRKTSAGSLHLPTRTPSLKVALTNSIGSISGASSAISSPVITAMGDLTPLPSPLLSGDSSGPWKQLTIGSVSPPQRHKGLCGVGEDYVLSRSSDELIITAAAAALNRKIHSSFHQNTEPASQILYRHISQQPQRHTRNRSLSEYIPDPAAVPGPPVTVSGSHSKLDVQEPHMKREQNLAESRGLAPSITQPPSPPPSESSKDSTDGGKTPCHEYFEAHGRNDQKRRRWRSICTVGQGTFSRVVLATSQMNLPNDVDTNAPPPGAASTAGGPRLDRKTLVAVKVCEHGPRGGASEERVEMSLKRELEMMQTVHHPSFVNLKAWSIEPTRAILVLTYCPGGDMFDIASNHRRLLTPALIRRIFAELVGAVNYLHQMMIVHRDIKLENVLVNLTPDELADPLIDWATYPHSVIALADLGLSRRITEEEKLETRCGSEDYAAPEVIMGQPYDGRATDAWSMGVLLYALLESRLPFDPHPGMSEPHRMRSRKSHRIARVEWRWIEYEGEDSEHEGSEAKFGSQGLLGAMRITEGLLKRARSRWTMTQVSAEPWVCEGITIDGGLRPREEVEGIEV